MNQKQKDLVKVFIFLFFLSFVMINWNDVSWIFNYREISGLVYDFFNPYQDSRVQIGANTSVAVSNDYIYAANINSLEIPAIGVSTPLVIGETTDVAALEKDLDKGVVYYPGSVLPGQSGQIVILGHSAPPNWPHIKHDYVFSDINNLATGDQIILYFNNTKYTYYVKDKKIIAQGQDVGSVALSKTNNVLTLISCWPPGKNYQRITVTAQLNS